MTDIEQLVSGDVYQAMTGSGSSPSSGNPFATMNDTLYVANGSLTSPRTVTMAGNGLTFTGGNLTLLAGNLGVGGTPFASTRLFTKGIGDTGASYGFWHENLSGTTLNYFTDAGIVVLAATGGTTTMGLATGNYLRQNVQETQQFSNSATRTGFLANLNAVSQIAMRATSIAVTDIASTGNLVLWAGWNGNFSSGSTDATKGILINNTSYNVQINAPLNTTNPVAKLTVRGAGATASTLGLQIEALGGGVNLRLQDDGLLQINTTATTTTFAGAASRILVAETLVGAASTASVSVDTIYTPTANNAIFTRAFATRVDKKGTFNTSTIVGVNSEAKNSGTGAITNMTGVHATAWAISTGTVTSLYGMVTQPQIQAAATVTDFGGLKVVLAQQTLGTITNHYGIHVLTPTNTGATITNTYGLKLESNALGGTANWGLWVGGSTRDNYIEGNLSIGVTTSAGKLLVRGANGAQGTNMVTFENSSGQDKYVIQNDGTTATGVGFAATASAIVAHNHIVGGYATAYHYNITGATSRGILITQGGNTPTGLQVSNGSSSTGTVYGANFDSKPTASTISIGARGFAWDGTTHSIGLDGAVGSNGTATTAYIAAVRGAAASAEDDLSYGGYFTAAWNDATTVFVENMVAVYGWATTQTGDGATSTSTGIGGMFLTSGSNGSGLNMAINVPATTNNGNVVFGADASTANQSLVEVTGDIEIIGSANGIILESPDATRYRAVMANGGTWSIATA